MPERSVPPYRIPVYGWIAMLLALAMFIGLITIVVRDHRRLGHLTLGPAGAPSAVAAAPAPAATPLATG